jgi:alpha-glucoside transport system permease protein
MSGSTVVDEAPPGGVGTAPNGADEPDAGGERSNAMKMVLGLVGMVVVSWALANLFLAFGYYPEKFGNKIFIGIVAVVAGVVGAAVFFYFLNMMVEGLPPRLSHGLMPYAFVLPALALLSIMLLYPTIQTINYSFANSDSTEYVGLQNYQDIFSDPDFWESIINNALWLLVVPAFTVAFGLVVAVMADKLGATAEKVSKSLIFMPMAISLVAATAVWGLVYAYNDASADQIGVLNAIWTGLGGEPQTWLQIETAKLNSLLLMVILIWLQTGFAMILLSSAIKSVPEDTLEAARIDGASEWQIFWRVVVPQVKGTMITVFITVTILVLKIFDIVYVSTNGNFETDVIANLFFNELFAADEAGRASAIVVVLLVAVTPVLFYQVHHFRQEEMNR